VDTVITGGDMNDDMSTVIDVDLLGSSTTASDSAKYALFSDIE
jgi:hypothetical protein